MGHLVVLALALFAGVCYAEPSRIVGGWPTTIERYPYIVQIESQGVVTGNWGQSCGANILNQLYVLSAAHCFEGDAYHPSLRRVRAGTTERASGGTIVYIITEYNHPEYRVYSRFDADISVIRLASYMAFTPVIQPGRIPAQGANIPNNSPVIHAGWGRTWSGGPFPTGLLYTQIYTIDWRLCAERYLTLPNPQVVTENMICAGLLEVGGRDACQGDSGGPLYYADDIIVGIVSWGHGCANGTFPGLSTAVWPYTNWIVDVVSQP